MAQQGKLPSADISVWKADNGEVTLVVGFTRHYLLPREAIRIGADLIDRAGGLPEGPDNPKSQLADLERILELTVAVRKAEASGLWRSATENGIDQHGAACEQLWGELYRQVDARKVRGKPVKPKPPSPDDGARAIKRVKQDVLARLMEELPGTITSILNDCLDEISEDRG